MKGKVISPMLYKEIIEALEKNNLVIASVHPSIRENQEMPRDNRGHLVLILVYDMNKKIFYFHNPSGFNKQSQEYVEISFNDFNKFFANRGITIQS